MFIYYDLYMNELLGTCVDCPNVCDLSGEAEQARQKAERIRERAGSREVDDDIAPRVYERLLDETGVACLTLADGVQLPIDSPAKMAEAIRAEAEFQAAGVEAEARDLQTLADNLISSCPGGMTPDGCPHPLT